MKKGEATIDLDYLFELEAKSEKLKQLNDLMSKEVNIKIESTLHSCMHYGMMLDINKDTKIITLNDNELKKEFDEVMDSLRETNKGQREEIYKLRKKKWYQFVKI